MAATRGWTFAPAEALDEAMKLPPQQGDQQRSYSFDEAMKLPPQEPEPDSALGAC
jgi:hypothetical protein